MGNLRYAADQAISRGDGELLARLATKPRNWLHNIFRVWEEWAHWLEMALSCGVAARHYQAAKK